MSRLVIAHTPLPPTKLLFRSMFGHEGLSSLYSFTVELVSDDSNIDLKALLSKSLSLEITQTGLPTRWLNGDIVEIALKGKEEGSSRYYVYQAEIRPKLWYLSQNSDCKIFQEQTVPDIIMQVLANFNVNVNNCLSCSYRTWQYCVQYQESDFDFISRLMEHEGIYYYFEHQLDSQTLVLTDAIDAHQPIPGLPLIYYRGPEASAITDEPCVDQWQISDVVTPKIFSTDDYNFHKPYATLLDVKVNPASYSSERTEIYEWPGHYIDQSHAQTYTKVRQQEKEAQQEQMKGSATTLSLMPGYKISLLKAARTQDNREYLIVQTHYQLWDNTYASGSDASKGQRTDFMVIPSDIQWRAPRLTAWPKTHGPQTARVVCPEGETIWTDKYGRVKVKFHWDRYAKGDDTSSCWVRVASAWAGQGFGGVQIPRLNDEVVIDFINGDPDRPIIIGRVYNEANMPPWDLPANATQMGFLSRSKGGHKGTANALRFEDKAGEEQLFIEAQRNQDINVKNDETHSVGVNRSKTVGGDETTSIKQNRTETVDGNETITVNGGRTETVAGDETISVKSNRTETVDGNETVTISGSRDKTVTGNDSLAVAANRTVNVTGNEDRTIAGSQTQTIQGSQTQDITGTLTNTVGVNLTETIGADMSTSVGGTQALNVTGHQSSTINGGQTIIVTGDQSITITANQTVNSGGEINIIAANVINLICGASTLSMDSGGNISINGVNITSSASADHIVSGTNVTASASADHVVEGAKLQLNP